MSSVPRLFTTENLHEGAVVPGTDAQRHYLKSVMRRASGQAAVLFNGRDGAWQSDISLSDRDVQFAIRRRLCAQTAGPDLWLVFAPLRRDATELVVQKATELGVAELRPVMTARTQPARLNAERLRLIAIEAAEQSERLSVPIIQPAQNLVDLVATWPTARKLFVAAERRTAPAPARTPGPAALLIGPEGGFAESELDALCQHPFVHPVSLGPNILRAETAAVAGLALLLLSA